MNEKYVVWCGENMSQDRKVVGSNLVQSMLDVNDELFDYCPIPNLVMNFFY